MLKCNNAAFLTWTALRIWFVGCDFECHKKIIYFIDYIK
jgi:hypothetical protein